MTVPEYTIKRLSVLVCKKWNRGNLANKDKQALLSTAGLSQHLYLADGEWVQITPANRDLIVRAWWLGITWSSLLEESRKMILRTAGLQEVWSTYNWIVFDTEQTAALFQAALKLRIA